MKDRLDLLLKFDEFKRRRRGIDAIPNILVDAIRGTRMTAEEIFMIPFWLDNPKPYLPPEPALRHIKYQCRKGASDEERAHRAHTFEEDRAEWARSLERLTEWERKKSEFENYQLRNSVQKLYDRDPGVVMQLFRTLLGSLNYPVSFTREIDVSYSPQATSLVVDYLLPPRDSIAAPVDFPWRTSEKRLSEKKVDESWDRLLYQVCLRSIFEIFCADETKAIDSVVFNGWVRFTDNATGHEKTACILSLQSGRSEFLALNLANVEPKACFKALKGIGSSKLHGMTPIAPIVQIDRRDKRFISSYEVAGAMDAGYNIAAMDWKDFEQLVRELLEKEFAQGGGEVKVTQASRDGGVDAIAFDPDPLRGGKIVIQAKRYTNVVGMAAVRELYGTVINEGASKGILITTADYGPDAYEFAKGKPLTLLSGANLLHLLGRHGYKAKIDLTEAKQILREKKS